MENKLKQIDQSVKNDQAAKFLAIFEENRKQEYPRRQHVIADFDFDGAANTTQALARTGAYKIVEYATIVRFKRCTANSSS